MEAIKDCTLAIARSRLANAYFTRGRALRMSNHPAQAIVDFNKTEEIDPNDTWLYQNRARCYLLLNKPGEAIRDATRVIETWPDHADPYTIRGEAYSRAGRHEAALADQNTAIRLDPNKASFYVDRAYTYGGQRQYEKGIEDCNRALAIDASCAEALAGVDDTTSQAGRVREGVIDVEMALRKAPENPDFWNNLGRVYRNGGDLHSVIRAFQKALDCGSRDWNVRAI